MDEITASELETLQRTTTRTARKQRTSHNGRNAGEHPVAAARAIYNHAIADGHIDPLTSPAHRDAKPRRNPSTRRTLTTHQLEDINTTTRAYGNDVILDALLLRLSDRLPWVATQGISTHWLRHTTLTWVERHFGYAVARCRCR